MVISRDWVVAHRPSTPGFVSTTVRVAPNDGRAFYRAPRPVYNEVGNLAARDTPGEVCRWCPTWMSLRAGPAEYHWTDGELCGTLLARAQFVLGGTLGAGATRTRVVLGIQRVRGSLSMFARKSNVYSCAQWAGWRTWVYAATLLLISGTAQAQLTILGNNGQDGAFEPNSNIEVDLSQAVTGQWDTTNSTGEGVYDPDQWAVIFRYTSVTIPSDVTITFKNHSSRAPVIWLVQGDVTIEGTVNLNGVGGHDGEGAATFSEPGPGGFRGGRGPRSASSGSAGLGPGGGGYPDAGGSYGGVGVALEGTRVGSVYGNDGIFPLFGGSGGSGTTAGYGGGAGGGAILIALSDTLDLNGAIHAEGGDSYEHGGGGSGGAVRIVADIVDGHGSIDVSGGYSYKPGGEGRVRVEANTITLTAAHLNSTGVPTTPPRIFREPADEVPTISEMVLNGQTVPADPKSYPVQDVGLVGVDDEDTVTLAITAEFVPEGSTVNARVVRLSGVEEVIAAAFAGSAGNETFWNAEIAVAGGFSTIQVHAVLP